LVAQITADLYESSPLKEKTPGGSFSVLSLKTSKVRDLSIASTIAALSIEIKLKFQALATKENPKSLLVAKKGKSSITHLNLTPERELLRDYIIKGMTHTVFMRGNIREIFAAKVLSALYNQEAYFLGLFLIKEAKSTGRSELAQKVLSKIGSVLKSATTEATAATSGDITTHLVIATIMDTNLMHGVYAASKLETEKRTAYIHLFSTEDTAWKDVIALSPEIKIANDRALMKAANTNAQKPAAHQQASTKPAANPPTPNKPAAAGKQTGRSQSAPTKATHTQQQQGQNTGKRGRHRKQQQQQRIHQPQGTLVR
jgi:hypothetical protein